MKVIYSILVSIALLSSASNLWAQKVGINTTNPQNPLHIVGRTQIDGRLGINQPNIGSLGGEIIYSAIESVAESSDSSDLNLALYEESGFSPWLNFAKARGTKTAPLKVAKYDNVFSIYGHAHDGVAFNKVGGISLVADDETGSGNVPTAMDFFTSNANEATLSHRMRIDHKGYVGIGTLTPEEKLHVEGNALIKGETFLDAGRLKFQNTSSSIYIGDETGINALANDNLYNTFIGNGAGKSNVSGFANVYIGSNAGNLNQIGQSNIAIGEAALASNTASFNTAIGKFALQYNNNGSENAAIGNYAGFGSQGSQNFFLGTAAGEGAAGSGNVFIGKEVGSYSTVSNKLWIANTNTDEPLIDGDFQNSNLKINGNVQTTKKLGVNIAASHSSLEVGGSIALKVKSGLESGVNDPDETASIWIYTTATGIITLPSPASCPSRVYNITNKTPDTLNISSYINLANSPASTIESAKSIDIVSDGTSWQQIK